MKKYIYPIILLALTSGVLSSCGTLSITKRVHNKGYHVEYTKHYVDSKNENIAESTETVIPKSESKVVDNHTKTGSSTLKSESNDLQVQKNVPIETTTETASNQHSNNQIKPNSNKKSVTDLSSSFKPMKVIFGNNDSKQTVQKMAPVREGGVSMLWIVIIIVLILWLLGYLGGLGSFIHLLLVIALILLILWLLRVI
jgi:hypothetical protein